MSKEAKLIVSKGNDLIDARYSLSAAGMNIFNAMLARVNPKEEALPVFEFDEASLAEFMRNSHLDDATIHKYSVKLVQELLGLSVIFKKDVDNFRVSIVGRPVFKKAEVIYNKKTKKLEYAKFVFSEEIEPSIRRLSKNYTKFHLAIISRLESKHAKRIYEIFLREHAITKAYKEGVCQTVLKYSLEEFKWKIDLPDSYKRYDNLNKRVLMLAKEQINSKSNLSFDYKPLRENGRGYSHIEFFISDNSNNVVIDGMKEPEIEVVAKKIDPALETMILAIIPEVSQQTLVMLGEYSKDMILESLLDYSNEKTKRDIKRPVEYFLGILKEKSGNIAQQSGRQNKKTMEQLADTSWNEGDPFSVLDEESIDILPQLKQRDSY